MVINFECAISRIENRFRKFVLIYIKLWKRHLMLTVVINLANVNNFASTTSLKNHEE